MEMNPNDFAHIHSDQIRSSFESMTPSTVTTILQHLKQAGFQAYLVGGCVRDIFLGRMPHDFDIATSALPSQVLDLFDHAIPTGIAHGTITVIEGDEQVEVTTFRSEGEYKDHRHPESVSFVLRIEEDLARRDFTINAMAWDPDEGLMDPFEGRKDLRQGIIRAVRDPFERMSEDALRMFRAFRFAGRYGFEIESRTRQAIDALYPLAKDLAIERIVPEMEEILANSPQIIDQMTLLLKPWIPQLDLCLHTEQNSVYHYTDVLHHTLDALSALQDKSPVCLWALLLHDLGKPYVKKTYDGRDHFKKHEIESAKIAQSIVQVLKLPKKMADEIVRLVKLHDTFFDPIPENFYRLHVKEDLNAIQTEHLFAVQYGDIMAHTQHDRLKRLQAYAEYDHSRQAILPMRVVDLKVNGLDLQKEFKISGKAIGDALHELLHRAIMADRKTTREEQLSLTRKIVQERNKNE